MKSMHICLRDLSERPMKMILGITREAVTREEAKRRNFDLSDEQYVVDEEYGSNDPFLRRDKIGEIFGKFAEEARAKLPLGVGADVYVGFWSFSQGDFEIPKSFFDLISETGWKVTFDYNS